MKKIFHICLIVLVVLGLGGCQKKLNHANNPINNRSQAADTVYYSQVSLQYEKGRHVTTNYRRGTLLPVNSQVLLMGMDDDEIQLEILPGHNKLRIVNVQKHTGDDTNQAFNKLFAAHKLDLKQFSKWERENIMAGKVAKKMRKKAVLAAIGYPPITETPSTADDKWTYWSSRFDRFIVYFENDKVARITD